MPHPRKQSLATALRLMRSVITKAERLDFTTHREDRALNTVFAAVSALYNCLQDLGKTESFCDCAERSWYGPGHDSQCNLTQIQHVLEEVGHAGEIQVNPCH